jgi:CRISPR-associated DxTHG motif protein
LNGTGFVKASGTNITYDNSSYLRTGLADSTYLKLTGGTLTGNLRLSSSNATQLNIDANDNNLESRITFSTVGSARSKIYTTSSVSSMTFESIAQASAKRGYRFISSTEETQYLGLVQDPQGNVGIKSDATGNDIHPNTLYVNGTLGVTGAITEGGNNVLTNLDTASLSSRIDAKLSTSDTASLSNRINLKYNSSGGTISGAVTLSTTSATPTSLLGKDGSNVVGSVTTVAQTGLFGRGSVTNAVTDANGNITVAHGFNFTPIMAFANLPASTTNIVNVKEVDGTNITFIVRDGATNNVLNAQTVTKIEFFAIK